MNCLRTVLVIVACVGLGLTPKAQASICLSLGDALRKADAVNLQVMMANARIEQAIARLARAKSDLLPHLDGTANAGRQTADLRAEGILIPLPGFGPRVGPYNNFDARARVTMALWDPSAWERFQAARKGEDLSEAEMEKTREDVLALVADLFIDAQRKQQTAKLFKILFDRDQMTYGLSQQQYTQGTGTLLDSNKSKSTLDQSKYLYTQAGQQAQEALLDLEAALQMPLDMPVVFLDDKDLMKTLERHAASNFNDAGNADMALAASTLGARQADQKTASADFLPKISGTADYGRSGESPAHGSNTYFAGVQASVPIWEGGVQQARLKEAKGQVKEAEAGLLDAAQQAHVNIAKARMAIVEASDLKKAKAQARQTAQRALHIAFQAEEVGNGTVLEVMQAKADLALAEDGYNEAQAAWVMAHIDLLHAQGRLRQLVRGS